MIKTGSAVVNALLVFVKATLATVLLAPASAGAFELEWPVDCTLGLDCFIQQYPDRDPGPGVVDYTCGPLSYDGHKGTDIALLTRDAMEAGVTVRAAAAGTVRAMRDGMPDIATGTPGAPDITQRECGNAVIIDHADGWQTAYCHMAQGSVLVRSGDVVQAGTPLGRVGLSGMTQFPHLDLTLRRGTAVIDPGDPDGALACGEPPAPALWSGMVPYQAGGIITSGMATEVPDFDAVKQGLPALTILTGDAPALVLWAHLFGMRAGDALRLSLHGPQGLVFDETIPLPRTQARVLRAFGKRQPAMGWPLGDYRGEITVSRKGHVFETRQVALTLR